MANPILFPDEIAEILRSLNDGDMVTIPGTSSGTRCVKVSCRPVNDDGIITTDRRYIDTRSCPGSEWVVPPEVLIDEIYNAVESGEHVMIDELIETVWRCEE